eukprot:TRINITY_DN7275_c0_g1_i2.p2 TRINITY_DN7275_c0_g1~~TRINITY_DN7275_c0_g1_i2.p2  ORF type:complete len:111 (+),score=26.59 TRINITY_DN7275_c0_g1_i2:162-494(+)
MGKAAFKVPRFSGGGSGMESVTLHLKESLGTQNLGSLDLAVEARWVEKGRLQEMLNVMAAERQSQAYSSGITSFAAGKVENDRPGDATCRSLKFGLPIAPSSATDTRALW